MRRLVLIFFSAFFFFSSPVMAKDGREGLWIVSQLSGDARVVHGGLQRTSLKVNSKLQPGDVVITGATGRATLSRNADYIVIAPRSELRLPAAAQPNGFTRVIQTIGTMLFKVQRTGTPHFAVDTPMLAAVVKGTTFTVIVDQNRSAVQVTEGVVEVSANDGGMKLLVNGGKTVFINHSDPRTLIDADSQPSKASTTASSAAVKVPGSKPVSLAAIAGLTSGLVRADMTPQPTAVVASATTVPATSAPISSETATATTAVTGATSGATETIVDVAETTETTATETIVDVVDATDPVVEVVEDTVTDVTEPVVEVVEDTVTDVTEPVVDVVEDTVTDVTEPVVEVVDDSVTTVTEPVVETVETTVPEVTEPVVETVETTVPEVTEPVVETVETTVPEVTEPIVDTIDTTVPEVTVPEVPTVPTPI